MEMTPEKARSSMEVSSMFVRLACSIVILPAISLLVLYSLGEPSDLRHMPSVMPSLLSSYGQSPTEIRLYYPDHFQALPRHQASQSHTHQSAGDSYPHHSD